MRGVGDGAFGAFEEVGNGDDNSIVGDGIRARPYHMVDLDDDGDMDFIWSHYGSGYINFYLNDGEENFTLAKTMTPQNPGYPEGYRGYVLSSWIGDFTGDGILDIVYAQKNGNNFGLYKGTETPLEFDYADMLPNSFALNFRGNPVGDDSPVDIDGDGDLDLVVGSVYPNYEGANPMVLRNDGDTFSVTEYTTVNFPGNAGLDAPNDISDVAGILVGDYNRDGVLDLAHYTTGDGGDFSGVGILLGTRPGEFVGPHSIYYPPGNFYADTILVEDFDGDGILDISTTLPTQTASATATARLVNRLPASKPREAWGGERSVKISTGTDIPIFLLRRDRISTPSWATVTVRSSRPTMR